MAKALIKGGLAAGALLGSGFLISMGWQSDSNIGRLQFAFATVSSLATARALLTNGSQRRHAVAAVALSATGVGAIAANESGILDQPKAQIAEFVEDIAAP